MDLATPYKNSYLFTWGDSKFFDTPENRRAYRTAPEPVFESMTPSFWVDHFGDMELPELRDLTKTLGIKCGFAGYQMRAALVGYFHNLVTYQHPAHKKVN